MRIEAITAARPPEQNAEAQKYLQQSTASARLHTDEQLSTISDLQFLLGFGSLHLEYELDAKNQLLVKVVNEVGTVVREVPPEEAVKLSRTITQVLEANLPAQSETREVSR